MLDLNYVRENLDAVRAALEKRGMATSALDDFVQADGIRRQAIAESDQLNAERNKVRRAIRDCQRRGRAAGTRADRFHARPAHTGTWLHRNVAAFHRERVGAVRHGTASKIRTGSVQVGRRARLLLSADGGSAGDELSPR